MKVLLLANTDPTSSTIFKDVCHDDQLEIVGIAFTQTLTRSKSYLGGVFDIYKKSGLPYFLYLVFWNSVFLIKERISLSIPFLRKIFFRNFFSLRLWAKEANVRVVSSSNFNSPEFLEWVAQEKPDVLFTRMNQILKNEILNSAPFGCWCFHSSELPRYQGIAAEFHSMRNDEDTVGFTVMQMERKLDTGPIIAQESFQTPEGLSLHGLIKYNNVNARAVISRAINDLIAGTLEFNEQDASEKSYYSWPTSSDTKAFRRRGHKYISLREIIEYIFE